MQKLPESGQLTLTRAEFEALVKEHKSLSNGVLQKYGRHATRVEVANDLFTIDYITPTRM